MRIAVVDAQSTGRWLVERLRARGVECVHVDSFAAPPEPWRRREQAEYAIGIGFHADPADAAAVLRDYGVERVVAGSESGTVLADRLNALLGTPGNDVRYAAARRDKVEMARLVQAAGLAVPLGSVLASAEAAEAWFRASRLAQAVVKPRSSAGTDGVRFCRGADEVRRAAEAIVGHPNQYGEFNTDVLVQERLSGDEFYVNTVSRGGVHRLAEIWRYVKQGNGGSPIYDYDVPVRLDSRLADELCAYTFGVLDALGVTDSAAHTEVMLTERGPVLIESAARLGGGTVPEIVQAHLGVAHGPLFLDSLLDPAAWDRHHHRSVRWHGHLWHVELINRHPGTVQNLDWLKRIEGLDSAVRVVAAVTQGDWLDRTADLASAPGYVYLAADNMAQIRRDYTLLREMELQPLYTVTGC